MWEENEKIHVERNAQKRKKGLGRGMEQGEGMELGEGGREGMEGGREGGREGREDGGRDSSECRLTAR